MMTRKDYVNVADILLLFRDDLDRRTLVGLIDEFSDMFEEDNPNFKRDKFFRAVMGE